MAWILTASNGKDIVETVSSTDDMTVAFTTLLKYVDGTLFARPTDKSGKTDISSDSKYFEFLKKGGKVVWVPNDKFYYLMNGENMYTSDGYVVVKGDLRDFTKVSTIVWPEKLTKMDSFTKDITPAMRMKRIFKKGAPPPVQIEHEWDVMNPEWHRYTLYRLTNLTKYHDEKVMKWIHDWRAAYVEIGKTTPDECPFVAVASSLPLQHTYHSLQSYERALIKNIQWMDRNPPGVSEDDPVIPRTKNIWKTDKDEIDDPTGLPWQGFNRETGVAYEEDSDSESESESESEED